MTAFLLLFALLYGGWGVLSPFLPAVLAERGATAEQIGLLLAIGIGARLVSMPVAGALADRLGAPRAVLAVLLLAGAASGLGYGMVPVGSAASLLLVGLVQHAATGPLGPLPDALAVRAAARPRRSGGFDYGVVRGAGAAAFIAGSALAGRAVEAAGSASAVLWLNAGLFAAAAGAVLLLPRPAAAADAAPPSASDGPRGGAPPRGQGMRALLAIPAFRRLLLVSSLVAGSHAFYAGFATLRWQAAGIDAETIGLLWSVSVASEVLVFFLLGRPLLARLGPGGLLALSGAAGALRWSVMAATAWPPAMFLAQPLHGLTFAAQHLAAMAVIARVVPGRAAATAQSAYGVFGNGAALAALSLVSGTLYRHFGAGGYWAMALLCAAAVPLALRVEAAAGLSGEGRRAGAD